MLHSTYEIILALLKRPVTKASELDAFAAIYKFIKPLYHKSRTVSGILKAIFK
jgi:hypothetical protein